ncbi:MAG: fumarate reductase subunit C [Rhodoferax sp.]|uniref:fumarate reductase subunit C n=1 Tax=Rhodoferax sp. TaxID=50421 RepID=UPI003016F679
MSRKPYVRPVSKTGWYFKHPRYLRYMSREVTCIFIGAFALLMVCTLERLSKGQAAFDSFMAALTGPWSALGLLVILAFAVHNATSWFNVTPKALPVQMGEEFLAGKYIIGAHYAVWLVTTVSVLLFAGVF